MGTQKKAGNRGKGRKKGVPNKRTVAVQEKIDELGCDPIEGVAACIRDILEMDGLDAVERGRELLPHYKALLPHYAPTLKAVEVSGGMDVGSGSVVLKLVPDKRPSGKAPE